MNKAELKEIIAACCNDIVFIYNHKKSGVTSEVHDSIPTFQVWYGEDTKEYFDVETVMEDRFFGGKSLNDLVGVVRFTVL